jgi:hypothetical protein
MSAIIYSKKYNYAIKYNSKSGCSFIRILFLELHRAELEREPTNHYHQLWKDFIYNQEQTHFTLNVVRNPYTRVVSMFTNKFLGPANTLYKHIQLPKDSFFEFVKHLYKIKKELFRFPDVHVRPQKRNYDPKDIVIKLENLNEELLKAYDNPHTAELFPKVKLFLEANSQINKTQRNNSMDYIYNKEFPTGILLNWPDYKYFYNDQIKNIVFETYREDFELYKYDKDSI